MATPQATIRRQGFNSKAPPGILKPPNFKMRTVQTPVLNVTLMERAENGCAFPTTDLPPHLFCGLPRRLDPKTQIENSSYCADHHALCWTQPKQLTGRRG